ncbi:MAG: hypothetical protein K5696_04150 [Lachnospiraceae bacterium]|nr:hypothetical protein [Lachnospiraceae bacterium]
MAFTNKLDREKKYTRKELHNLLCETMEGCSYNSFNWYINQMISGGVIHKYGRNTYMAGNASRKDYMPRYGEKSGAIIAFMEKVYPDTDYSLFETSMLNEFLNHQIAKNTFFLYVEKELSDFVFRDIEDTTRDTVLIKPGKSDLRRYWKPDSIIILDRVSEAPAGRIQKYDTPLEKLFIDLISDQSLMYMYSQSEYPEMLQLAYEKYYMDRHKLSRYARRRGKLQELQKAMIMGGIEVDNT